MAVNKVIYDSETLIDLTGDTVDAEHLAKGYTAHNKAGNLITGIMSAGGLPDGISAIKFGTHTVASDTAYGTGVTINHNLGVIPDLFLIYPITNTSVTYSELFMARGPEIMYRGSSYHTLTSYRGNSSSSASATFVNSSKGGIYQLTATTATISGHQSSYYVRAGQYKYIAIKFS